jgi:hypothetical protein
VAPRERVGEAELRTSAPHLGPPVSVLTPGSSLPLGVAVPAAQTETPLGAKGEQQAKRVKHHLEAITAGTPGLHRKAGLVAGAVLAAAKWVTLASVVPAAPLAAMKAKAATAAAAEAEASSAAAVAVVAASPAAAEEVAAHPLHPEGS